MSNLRKITDMLMLSSALMMPGIGMGISFAKPKRTLVFDNPQKGLSSPERKALKQQRKALKNP